MTNLIGALCFSTFPLWTKAKGGREAGVHSLRPRADLHPISPGLDSVLGVEGARGRPSPLPPLSLVLIPELGAGGEEGVYSKFCFLPESPHQEPHFPV